MTESQTPTPGEDRKEHHYREAIACLQRAQASHNKDAAVYLAAAQVHATLCGAWL